MPMVQEGSLSAPPAVPAPGPAGERMHSIDALRAIMCVGIALNHFVPYFFGPDDVENQYSRFFSYFTDMFAVFAGLFAARHLNRRWSTEGYREFLVTRTARLYPLHVVTMGFYVVLALPVYLGLLHPQNSARYSMEALIPHLTLTHAWGLGPPMAFNYPSWMISGIFGCYLAMPLLGWAARRSKWMMLGALFLALAVSMVCAWMLHTDITRLQSLGWGLLRTVPSFIFGLILGNIRSARVSRRGAMLLLGASLIVAFGVSTPLQGLERLAVIYMLVFAVVSLDRARIESRDMRPAPLRSLRASGKFSFGVYLWHGVVATILFRVATPRIFDQSLIEIGDREPVLAYTLIVAGLAAAFILAAISLYTIERHGAKLFVRLWSGRRAAVTAAV